METILLPVQECEVELALYGKRQWIQCIVLAIAVNQKSAIVNWKDAGGESRETEVPLGFLRYELFGRRRRGFQRAKEKALRQQDHNPEAIAPEPREELPTLVNSTPSPSSSNAAIAGTQGWIETYYIKRGEKEYGPYRRHCWREGGKKRHKYLGGGF
jgi:hypothetical protein